MSIIILIFGIAIVWFFGSAMLKANRRMHHADKLRAQRTVNEGKGIPPSWIQDRNKNEIFLHGIQNLAMQHGVPQSFLSENLSIDNTLISLVNYAGAMEQEGSSFMEQQMAVSEKLVEMWRYQG